MSDQEMVERWLSIDDKVRSNVIAELRLLQTHAFRMGAPAHADAFGLAADIICNCNIPIQK